MIEAIIVCSSDNEDRLYRHYRKSIREFIKWIRQHNPNTEFKVKVGGQVWFKEAVKEFLKEDSGVTNVSGTAGCNPAKWHFSKYLYVLMFDYNLYHLPEETRKSIYEYPDNVFFVGEQGGFTTDHGFDKIDSAYKYVIKHLKPKQFKYIYRPLEIPHLR